MTSILIIKNEAERPIPAAPWGWLIACGLPVLAVLVQVQATFTIGDTKVRFNAADIALVLFAPLILVAGLVFMRDLLKIAGGRLLLALALGSLSLTYSLYLGYAAIGDVTIWAAVKYAGWYVLLFYLGVGILLGLLAGGDVRNRFLLVFVAFQLLLVMIFLAISLFATDLFDTKTVINLGPRLIGFAGNPNTMAFYLLCGLCLLLPCLETADWRSHNGKVLLAAAAILVAGMLFTRSVAALIALATILVAATSLRIAPLKKVLLVTALAGVLWTAPQIIHTSSGVTVNVFDKTMSLLTRNTEDSEQTELGIKTITLKDRLRSYREALNTWQHHPFFGAGLGTHLHEQIRRPEPNTTPIQIHSTALWLLAETGIVGGSIMAAIFVLLFWVVWRSTSPVITDGSMELAFPRAVVLVLLGWAVMSLFHELMYQRALWLLAGMALSATSIQSPVRSPLATETIAS